MKLPNIRWKCVCGQNPCDGLDCGIYLPGQAPYRKPLTKPAEEIHAIRMQAWATRREKYGKRGHR